MCITKFAQLVKKKKSMGVRPGIEKSETLLMAILNFSFLPNCIQMNLKEPVVSLIWKRY
jgi:hypothetical protein